MKKAAQKRARPPARAGAGAGSASGSGSTPASILRGRTVDDIAWGKNKGDEDEDITSASDDG
jgi:hypothetical protein